MKLKELKHNVHRAWNDINTWKGGIVIQPENFQPEMKTFGDLRCKDTWVKALARFEATLAYQSCLDAWSLILYTFNFTPDRWDYEYRHAILEEFLLYPDALDLIKLGLEQLQSVNFTPKERQEAHGFFKLVANKDETNSQLSLLGESQELVPHRRVDGATVYQDFAKSIRDAEGSDRAIKQSVIAETRELFDCTVDQLYTETGGKKGDRSTLPTPAQEAYIVNETISKHRLNHDVAPENNQSRDQPQKDDRIVETVRDTAENAAIQKFGKGAQNLRHFAKSAVRSEIHFIAIAFTIA